MLFILLLKAACKPGEICWAPSIFISVPADLRFSSHSSDISLPHKLLCILFASPDFCDYYIDYKKIWWERCMLLYLITQRRTGIFSCSLWPAIEVFKKTFLSFHLLSSSVTYLYIRELSSYSFLTPAHLKSIDDEMNCCPNTFFDLPITFPFTQPFHLPLFSLFNLIQFVFSFLLLLWFLYRRLSFFVTAAQVTAIIADKPESSLFCHLHCAPNNIAANCNDG